MGESSQNRTLGGLIVVGLILFGAVVVGLASAMSALFHYLFRLAEEGGAL